MDCFLRICFISGCLLECLNVITRYYVPPAANCPWMDMNSLWNKAFFIKVFAMVWCQEISFVFCKKKLHEQCWFYFQAANWCNQSISVATGEGYVTREYSFTQNITNQGAQNEAQRPVCHSNASELVQVFLKKDRAMMCFYGAKSS